ncbi:hypothetical protein GJAV_G00190210 [Gymnothorax javanicus]|nr:hypothetical protein GJAV_G00190210 [Gymnothorax javanicus]
MGMCPPFSWEAIASACTVGRGQAGGGSVILRESSVRNPEFGNSSDVSLMEPFGNTDLHYISLVVLILWLIGVRPSQCDLMYWRNVSWIPSGVGGAVSSFRSMISGSEAEDREMGEAEAVQTDEKQADSGIIPVEESVIWSQEVEVCLFHAMLGHKPVGVNRHFHMICIRDKFSQNIGRQVSSKVIWDHLGTMYDMQALHESEILPFPNSEKSFVLPEEIIQEVKEGKLGPEEEVKEEIKEERDPPATHEEGLGPSLAGQDIERQQLIGEDERKAQQQRQGERQREGFK